jgi:hypothetical protein
VALPSGRQSTSDSERGGWPWSLRTSCLRDRRRLRDRAMGGHRGARELGSLPPFPQRTPAPPLPRPRRRPRRGPLSMSFGPNPMSCGVLLRSFEPSSRRLRSSSMSQGSSSMSCRPFSMSFGPFSMSFGPKLMNFGPKSMSDGPILVLLEPRRSADRGLRGGKPPRRRAGSRGLHYRKLGGRRAQNSKAQSLFNDPAARRITRGSKQPRVTAPPPLPPSPPPLLFIIPRFSFLVPPRPPTVSPSHISPPSLTPDRPARARRPGRSGRGCGQRPGRSSVP